MPEQEILLPAEENERLERAAELVRLRAEVKELSKARYVRGPEGCTNGDRECDEYDDERDIEWCSHVEHGIATLAAGEPPAPIPNTGGLLPCYYKADWEKVYSYASEHWEPPTYGVCADDWPTAEERREHGPRRLILVPGGIDGVRSEM